MVLDGYENVAIYGTLGQTLLFNLYQTVLTVAYLYFEVSKTSFISDVIETVR